MRPGLRNAVLVLALVLAVAVGYARVGTYEFTTFDDNLYLTGNAEVRGGLTARGAAWAFTTFHAANWHPLTWLSHQLDVELFGMDPGRHHLANAALHAAAAAALLLALRGMTGALWRPALVAFLFAVHPLNVETVAWVSERKNVLSTLIAALALIAYLRYCRRPGVGRYAVVVAAVAAGLLAKPMLVTLPFLLLLLDGWPLGRMGSGPFSWRRASSLLLEKLPLFALAAASAAVTIAAQRAGMTLVASEIYPLRDRIANALVSYLWYLGKAVWPQGLAMYYPHAGAGISTGEAVAAAAVLAAATAATLLCWRRLPAPAVGWFWYLGALVPVIGLVQVGMQGRADRYAYVPLIGIFVGIAWAAGAIVAWRPRLRPVVVTTLVAAVVALAAAAENQAGSWRDDRSVYKRMLAATGENWLAEMNIGAALYEQRRFEEAAARFREARRLGPFVADVHYDLGLAYTALGQPGPAADSFATAVQLRPADPGAHAGLGKALLGLGRAELALEHLREAARLSPGDPAATENLAGALEQLGRGVDAAAVRAEMARRRAARAP